MSSIRYYRNARQDQNKITLTFDDGPTPGVTEQVMEILEKNDIRGTFFAVGKWAAQPDGRTTLQRLMQHNHIIGNHTNHHYHPIKATIPYPVTEFADAEKIISGVLGAPTRYVRAPYLAYGPNVCAALQDWIGNRKIIDGKVSGFDWENWQSPEKPQEITRSVLDSPELRNGSIIYLHDGSEISEERFVRPAPMIEALPEIIRGLRARGFEIVGIDELTFDEDDIITELY